MDSLEIRSVYTYWRYDLSSEECCEEMLPICTFFAPLRDVCLRYTRNAVRGRRPVLEDDKLRQESCREFTN